VRRPSRTSWLLVALALTGGCKKQEPALELSPCPDTAEQGTPVDPVLLAFLSRARSAHHLADAREQTNDLRGAVAALETFTKGPAPAGAARPEVREVLSDTEARLADLESRLGNTEAAERALERGLALVPDRNYFRGHLFEVRGLLEERKAESLSKTGDLDGAKAAKERALTAFEEAMRIQAEVIEGAAPRAP
jgi:tetratricopeptide (TPR) repeat protein